MNKYVSAPHILDDSLVKDIKLTKPKYYSSRHALFAVKQWVKRAPPYGMLESDERRKEYEKRQGKNKQEPANNDVKKTLLPKNRERLRVQHC